MPKKHLVALIGVGVAVLIAVASVLVWHNNRFEYDEDAHRNVVEGYGGPVADWDAYREAVQESCAFDEETFELYVLMEEDLARLQLDIEYACPDRMDEFTDITGRKPF